MEQQFTLSLILILSLSIPSHLFAQAKSDSVADTLQQTDTTFRGQAVYRFIQRNMRYPAPARRMGVQGLVLIEFTIDDQGLMTSTKLIKDLPGDCGKEVKRVLLKGEPGLGLALRQEFSSSHFLLPVLFGLGKAPKMPSLETTEATILEPVVVIGIPIERRFVSLGTRH